MEELPYEVIIYIMKYLIGNKCKHKTEYNTISCKINKYFFPNCKLNIYIPHKNSKDRYLDLYLSKIIGCWCKVFDDKNELIYKLNDFKKKTKEGTFPSYIHFSKESICKSAIKYVREYGKISRFCCDNKGINIIKCDEMVGSFI